VFCRSEEDIRRVAATIPGPWAVKAVAARLPHKTEAGAVRLEVADVDDAVRAYRECTAAACAYLGVDTIDGVLLTTMLPPPVAELLVGARRDPSFGPVLTVGFGGVDVDLAPDVAIRILPVSEHEVRTMWSELRRSPILFGHRGSSGVDLEGLVGTALAVGACLLEDERLGELELNPVFAYADRVIAVDAVGRLGLAGQGPDVC
jgi:acyl-CoA synthetase (NDP forming)